MNNKNEVYNLDSKGRIINYNINIDTDRFSFLSKESSFFEQMTDKVNSILYGMISPKEYDIDWKNVVKDYLQHGVGDVPHFAFQYVFERSLVSKLNLSNEQKEAMYLEIVDSVNGELKKGTLPKTLDELKTYKEREN